MADRVSRARSGSIKRHDGDPFSLVPKRPAVSPFDVPPVRTRATTQDILDAIRESRERG